MVQLRFDFEKDPEADAKIVISFAPATIANSDLWKSITYQYGSGP
jgi:hypothetical protein